MAENRNASVMSASARRHTVDERQLHVTSVFTKAGEHAVLDHEADADEQILVALGYRQEFKRFVTDTMKGIRAPKAHIRQRFHVARVLLRLVLRAGPLAFGRIDSDLQSRLLRSSRLNMGLDRSRNHDTDRRVRYGRAVLEHANRWGLILRVCSPRTRRLGSICQLVHWLVEFSGLHDWSMFCQLRSRRHDTRRCSNCQSELYA